MARLTNKQFGNLLKRASRIAREHSDVQQELTKAFNERYGTTYSDVDCDELIDILDYGGFAPTVANADEAMAKCGAPKLEEGNEE
jgi:hypothetical protein